MGSNAIRDVWYKFKGNILSKSQLSQKIDIKTTMKNLEMLANFNTEFALAEEIRFCIGQL